MSLYKQSPEGPWWVNITHDGERIRRSTGTYDRKEAQRVHDEIKASLWKETPKLKGRTWGMAAMKWVEKETRSESELLSLRKFSRYYPDRLITHITRDSVHEALSKFCNTAGTYTRYRTMIAAILNTAHDEGWLREVPKLATRTDKKAKPRSWLTKEQWKSLYAELPVHLRAPAGFAIHSGLRQANLLGLTWDRVDTARRLVWVEGEDTKSGKALAIPLSDEALNILAAQRVKGEHPEYVFTFRGKPFKKIKNSFQQACIRAELGRVVFKESGDTGVRRPVYEGFTWHGLRHTWATWHVQAGTPLGALKDLGGWSDLRMVLLYAHHTPDFVASFVNNVEKK